MQGIALSVRELTSQLTIQPTLRQKFIDTQQSDPYLVEKFNQVESGQDSEFSISVGNGLHYRGCLCVHASDELKNELLWEAHNSPFSIHPSSTKMYQDLKCCYWWHNMKKEVAEYVSKCLVCQQVKASRQKPADYLQPLSVPEWKWESISMDFIGELPRTVLGHTVI